MPKSSKSGCYLTLRGLKASSHLLLSNDKGSQRPRAQRSYPGCGLRAEDPVLSLTRGLLDKMLPKAEVSNTLGPTDMPLAIVKCKEAHHPSPESCKTSGCQGWRVPTTQGLEL